jgi:ADP-ribose pyrophosphatase YjhB (NUDIX family)
MIAITARRTARAILFNEEARVLLIKFKVVRDGRNFVFWATPGGSVELGESDEQAVEREILEELALRIQLSGPVHTSSDSFAHKGMSVQNTDVFFVGRCEQEEVGLHAPTEEEREAMQESKWWSRKELEETDEIIFPKDLPSLIDRFALTV